MADFTKNPPSGSSSSSSSHAGHSMAGMDMDMSSMAHHMSGMAMTFHVSTTTPLFSVAWTPASTGEYAGSCIFLIVLAVVFRLLMAYKTSLEHKWTVKDRNRRIVIAADVGSAAGSEGTGGGVSEEDLKKMEETEVVAAAAAGEKEGEGKKEQAAVGGDRRKIPAWRWSTDLPRAGLTTVITGTGYLLMLAVMTMNVGYFMSTLGGVFLGELMVGRYIGGFEH